MSENENFQSLTAIELADHVCELLWALFHFGDTDGFGERRRESMRGSWKWDAILDPLEEWASRFEWYRGDRRV